MAGFWFSKIHIIQSLHAGELRTGRILQGAILHRYPEIAPRLELVEIEDAESLRTTLVGILGAIESTGSIPFIHLECHGSKEGIELSSGDFVTWRNLADWLAPLNVACALNLFVSVAACHGDWFASAIDLIKPAPVWGLLGPTSAIAPDSLVQSFSTFFTTLVATSDLRAALDAAGGGLPTAERPLALWPAEYFFAYAFRAYVKEYCSSKEIASRAKRLAAQVQQQKGLPRESRREIARNLRHDLRNLEPHFKKFLSTYLMLDTYPENEARFQLNWAWLQELDPRR